MKLFRLISTCPSVVRLTPKGFLWAATAPAAAFLLLYSYVLHVRLAFGRWPKFGEEYPAGSLKFHETITLWVLGILFYSLFPAAAAFIVCLCPRRWRFVAWYLLGYGVMAGLALGSFFVAPAPFLNWFLD